jgi:hypothetical protein
MNNGFFINHSKAIKNHNFVQYFFRKKIFMEKI